MSRKGQGLSEIRSLETPAFKQVSALGWLQEDGTPWSCWCTPMTLSDMEWINKKAGGSAHKFTAYTIVRKAVDEQGEPLFTLADATELMNRRADELMSLCAQMNDGKGFDEQVKD